MRQIKVGCLRPSASEKSCVPFSLLPFPFSFPFFAIEFLFRCAVDGIDDVGGIAERVGDTLREVVEAVDRGKGTGLQDSFAETSPVSVFGLPTDRSWFSARWPQAASGGQSAIWYSLSPDCRY